MTSRAPVTTLPPLDADEQAHSQRVVEHIRAFMAANGGVIGFDAWMRLALYAPGLGYYSAGATKLGSAGDFVTAPEVSSLFSRCLARQAADVLQMTVAMCSNSAPVRAAWPRISSPSLRRSTPCRSDIAFSR